MSFFKPVGKAAKFALVTVPLSVFGWQLNKGLFSWLRSSWTRSISPACPECDQGALISHLDVEPVFERSNDRPRRLYPWVCNHCGYALLEESSLSRVHEVTRRLRMERAYAAFTDMEQQERNAISRQHKIASRLFFATSGLMFLSTVYMLATGASSMPILNWASFSLMFWVFAMKRSYRAWQVTSGHIFERGAARYWFKHEKWLI